SSDGATRHNDGIRIFIADAATATSGSGTITVANVTGQAAFTGTNQDFFQYGGQIGGVDQPELGADGILSSGEVSFPKQWQLNVPTSVGTFAFTLYVATEMPSGTPATAAPQVTSVSPAS